MQRLSEDICATNGATVVPSVFEIVDDEEGVESTTGGLLNSSKALSESILGLGKVGLEAARIEAEQLEKIVSVSRNSNIGGRAEGEESVSPTGRESSKEH